MCCRACSIAPDACTQAPDPDGKPSGLPPFFFNPKNNKSKSNSADRRRSRVHGR